MTLFPYLLAKILQLAFIELIFLAAERADYFGVTFREKEQPKPVEPEKPATDKLYRVQVGAFAVRENAERMLRRLRDAGFEGFIREGS